MNIKLNFRSSIEYLELDDGTLANACLCALFQSHEELAAKWSQEDYEEFYGWQNRGRS